MLETRLPRLSLESLANTAKRGVEKLRTISWAPWRRPRQPEQQEISPREVVDIVALLDRHHQQTRDEQSYRNTVIIIDLPGRKRIGVAHPDVIREITGQEPPSTTP